MKTYKSTVDEYKLTKKSTNFNRAKITSSTNAATFARQFYYEDIEIYESFFLVLLNQSSNTTGYVKISQGGTAGTVVDVALIAKYAVESLSRAVILVHNHPSGNLKPSDADKSITKRTKAALDLFSIKVLDHIILTADGYYSFGDEGLM